LSAGSAFSRRNRTTEPVSELASFRLVGFTDNGVA
jgi:hypothetical protein